MFLGMGDGMPGNGGGMEIRTSRSVRGFAATVAAVAGCLLVVGVGGCSAGALGRVEIAPARPEGLACSDDLGEVIRENQAARSVASVQPTPR